MSIEGAVGGLSIKGSSHVRANMPNQDAVAHDRSGAWFFLAVSDGHGAARHYRSDRGAVFAVDSALALLKDVATSDAGGLDRALPRIARDLVGSWRERVEADVRAWPVREAPGFDTHAVYGATCVAAAIGPGASLFVQIGDGDVFAAGAAGEVGRAIPLDPHLVGPGTYSLCQPDAVERVHVRLFRDPHPLANPEFVLAATDGLSKSYRRDEDFLGTVGQLRDSLRSADLADFLHEFEPWLAECSARGSRDDVSVAIYSGPRS